MLLCPSEEEALVAQRRLPLVTSVPIPFSPFLPLSISLSLSPTLILTQSLAHHWGFFSPAGLLEMVQACLEHVSKAVEARGNGAGPVLIVKVALSNNTIVNTPPLQSGEQAATTTVVEHVRLIVADMIEVGQEFFV